jgi:UPF0042 nucleotide-binding protein
VRIVVVTGLAGAGKSTALRALEDLGYYCVDNLPLPLFAELTRLLATIGAETAAVSVDARQHAFLDRFDEVAHKLRDEGHQLEVLFLEAASDVLLRRFSATRRRHPLAGDALVEAVGRDRQALAKLRDDAVVINTSDLNVHELKQTIEARYHRSGGMGITLQSFGFKYGLPADSDLVFDVRYLPNPHFEPELKSRDGRDAEVSGYVLDSEQGAQTAAQIEGFLRFALPRFAAEGKRYLTISIGCTGGMHRSVALSERLAAELGGEWDVRVKHRDVNRGGVG